MLGWLTIVAALQSASAFSSTPTLTRCSSTAPALRHFHLQCLDDVTKNGANAETAVPATGELVGKVIPTELPSMELPRLEKLSVAFDTSGWLVLGLCCAIATISSLDRVMMSVAILPMSAEMFYSDTTKGVIAAAFTTGYFLFFVPAGVVAATFSPSATLSVGLVVWSLAQAATPTAAYLGLTPLLACRAVMGVGESCTFPSIQAIAARWVPDEYRGRFWGVLTACFNVGTLVAYAASPALIEQYGWQASFVVYGAVGIALTAIWAAVGRDAPATPDMCVPDEVVQHPPTPRLQPSIRPMIAVLTCPALEPSCGTVSCAGGWRRHGGAARRRRRGWHRFRARAGAALARDRLVRGCVGDDGSCHRVQLLCVTGDRTRCLDTRPLRC